MLDTVKAVCTRAVLALLCVLVVVSCGSREEHRYYELNLDISVDGKRVQFTRYFDCVGVAPARLFPSPAGLGWTTTTGSVAARRLSNGGGIVFRSFYPCGRESFEPWTITRPDLMWFDDVENPQRIEAYRWDEYFKQPGARVVFHGGTARRVQKAVASDPAEELPWLEKNPQTLVAFRAEVVPEEIWGRDPILKQNLDKIQTSRDVTIAELWTPNLDNYDPHRFHFHEGYFMPGKLNHRNGMIEVCIIAKQKDIDAYDLYNSNFIKDLSKYGLSVNGKPVSDYWRFSFYIPEDRILIHMSVKSINQHDLTWSVF